MGEIAEHAETKQFLFNIIWFMTCFKDTFCSVLQTVVCLELSRSPHKLSGFVARVDLTFIPNTPVWMMLSAPAVSRDKNRLLPVFQSPGTSTLTFTTTVRE